MHTDPDWADMSFGVFICIDCSGIHRSLGAHIAKVRSIGLDQWTEENVQVSMVYMCEYMMYILMYSECTVKI